MKIRVVLLPDNKLETSSKKHSSLIVEKYPSFFRLDTSHIPHTTLTSLEFSDELFDKITILIKNLAIEKDKITVEANQIKTDGRGFIGIYFKGDSEIKMLQKKVIALLEPYSKEPLIAREPHITLTRLKSEDEVSQAIQSISDFPKGTFSFDYLAICEDGENGTCKSIIAKFPFR